MTVITWLKATHIVWAKIHKAGVSMKSVISTTGAPTYRLAKHLGSLKGHLSNSQHHMRNSEDFIHTLSTLQVQPNDILVSFDVISLFTWLLVGDSLNLQSLKFDKGNIRLF
jgi:hypothetical protein